MKSAFSVNGVIYKQNYGLLIASSMKPILAKFLWLTFNRKLQNN